MLPLSQWKTCTGCLRDKHVTEFEPKRSRCKVCVAKRRRARYAADPQPIRDRENSKYDSVKRQRKHDKAKTKNRLSLILTGVRHRCKKRGHEYDLDAHRSELQTLFDEGRCALTGIEFDLETQRAWNSPSIDRVRPRDGYTFGNVRFVLWSVNAALGHWGEDVLAEVASAFLERRDVAA